MTREERLLNVCKRMFAEWSGVTIEIAKEIIELETEINANKSDKPIEPVSSDKNYIPKVVVPPSNDNDDLPFSLFIPLLAASLLQFLV